MTDRKPDTQVMAALEVEQADRDFAESISHMLEYPHVDIPKIAALVASYRRAHSPASGDQEKVGRCDIESNLTGCLHPEEHQGRCGYSAPVAGESDLCEHCGEYTHDCNGHPTPVAGDAELRKALKAIQCLKRSIMIDVGSCHANRGPGASSAMREDDRDMRRDIEDAFALIDAALATPPSVPAQRGEGWQDIATAPRNAERIIVAVTGGPHGSTVCEAYWHPGDDRWEADWWLAATGPADYTSGPISDIMHGTVSHWRPLPAPPLPATPPSQDQSK